MQAPRPQPGFDYSVRRILRNQPHVWKVPGENCVHPPRVPPLQVNGQRIVYAGMVVKTLQCPKSDQQVCVVAENVDTDRGSCSSAFDHRLSVNGRRLRESAQGRLQPESLPGTPAATFHGAFAEVYGKWR